MTCINDARVTDLMDRMDVLLLVKILCVVYEIQYSLSIDFKPS